MYQNNSNNICLLIPLVSVRKRSCRKVMFSQACVKNSVHTGERCTPPGRQTPVLGKHPPVRQTPPGQTPPGQTAPLAGSPHGQTSLQADTPPPEMATATDSTHPTAMYSCYHLQCSCNKVMFSLFTVICHSVHGGGCIPPPRADIPWTDTPLARHPPGQIPPGQTPPGRHPLDKHPPGQTPPLGRHPPPLDGHCSGRYASCWNAFLL